MLDDLFPDEPIELFDQSRSVNTWKISHGTALKFFLIFERRASIIDDQGDQQKGVALAIYQCDTDGVVLDWDYRYEAQGRNSEIAFLKFAFMFKNGLICAIPVRAARRCVPLDEATAAQLDSLMCGE